MTSEQETPPTIDTKAPSAWVIRLAVAATILLVVAAIAVVGWRWMHVQFPNAALFIRGDATSEGVEVVVSNADGDPIFRDRMTAGNKYQLVVLVEHGVYSVLGRRDSEVLIRERLYVANGGGALVQVVAPTTRPASSPATEPAFMPQN